jgi:hypothetical protein
VEGAVFRIRFRDVKVDPCVKKSHRLRLFPAAQRVKKETAPRPRAVGGRTVERNRRTSCRIFANTNRIYVYMEDLMRLRARIESNNNGVIGRFPFLVFPHVDKKPDGVPAVPSPAVCKVRDAQNKLPTVEALVIIK